MSHCSQEVYVVSKALKGLQFLKDMYCRYLFRMCTFSEEKISSRKTVNFNLEEKKAKLLKLVKLSVK